jgi:hypothetical protein
MAKSADRKSRPALQLKEKKMAARKKFKAGTAANKAVRQLVQAMTPENRKHLHEGMRVAHREVIISALLGAFKAGRDANCDYQRGVGGDDAEREEDRDDQQRRDAAHYSTAQGYSPSVSGVGIGSAATPFACCFFARGLRGAAAATPWGGACDAGTSSLRCSCLCKSSSSFYRHCGR